MPKQCRCTATRVTSAHSEPTSSSAASTSAPAANDVGWERQPDGTYRAWVSEYDARHRFDQAMQNKIRQEYAFQVVNRHARARGRTVTRERLPSGEIEVTIGGYR